MTEERDSQLSAMFDGELPGAECELLARRLARDEALRSQWSRYSMIGAALRAERGVKLHDRVAVRVQAVLAQDAAYGQGADDIAIDSAARANGTTGSDIPVSRRRNWMSFARPALGAGIAASVAVMSIVWLRGLDGGSEPLVAATAPAPQTVAAAPDAPASTVALRPASVSEPVSNGEPERYTTPVPSSQPGLAPPARLANYVVAHSEVSGPLSRRMALAALMASENGGELPAAPESSDAENAAATEPADAQ